MGVAYITAHPINVVGGKSYRVAIDAPPRGEIIRAQCIQTSGNKTTFSFTFYNSAASCPPDPLDSNGFPVPPAASPVDPIIEYAGQIGPTRAVTTNQDRYTLADGSDGGWTSLGEYCNADGGISTAQRKLYMKFDAKGAGVYGIYITIKTTRD